jgi:hypothetical protein
VEQHERAVRTVHCSAEQFQEPVGASQRSRAGYFDYSIDVKTLPSGQC